MLRKQTKPENPVFFQIRKDGNVVDGASYSSLEEASAELQKSAHGGEVTQVDGLDQIVRRYTPAECRSAARNFLNKA